VTTDPDDTIVSADPDRGTPATILLVEDDAAVRGVSERALVRFGFQVLTASSGDEAVRLAETYRGPIHLVLTDIMMPGMNGVELAGIVSMHRPGIHVFFMSGYADQDLVRKGLLEPGTHFLQKPFSPRELSRRLRGILGEPPE
jgi:two-component system, cell cycle sensor histidine kinase and response regulator CckA